ncbi:MAG TPA: hypothetical protein ENI61_05040 [Ignavibacteria bacterium]|nr:hypothetical protein [Ignavibacteria bacterium]
MGRSISIYRRKSGLVDLLIRKRVGKTGFRFSAASNFDSTFSQFATVLNNGTKSKTVPDVYSMTVGDQFRDQVRFIFNPLDYVSLAPALIDSNQFFLRVEARNADGTFDAPEAMHLILPYPIEPRRLVLLRGDVPAATALSNSMEIQLPGQCHDFRIMNEGAVNMLMAFHDNGGEYPVPPLSSEFTTFEQFFSSITQIFMRGVLNSVTISMSLTIRNDPSV